MRSLSQITIVVAVIVISVFSIRQRWNNSLLNPVIPPHGENFNISCNVCHSSKGWKIDKEIYSFNHDSTAMPLIGQHAQVDCRICHPTLVFSEAKTECIQCHTDMHESTVGKECSRCHTPFSWLVNNITQIHQQSRFPLVGAHANVDCYQCHLSESFQRYDVIGTECYTCHSDDYAATTQPNHASSGYSTICNDCHTVFSSDWTNTSINHNFFPLTNGHDLPDCFQCHTSGVLAKIPSECVNCHQPDYDATTNPNHVCGGFSTDCKTCHTTMPGWKPSTFDHSQFPLTQGHALNDCSSCHVDCNYAGTSTECVVCHQDTYNGTTNPNHVSAGFPTDCKMCHTTAPGWKPATFDHTNFPLTQGHNISDCSKCHVNGNYNNVSSECVSCHQTDYNNTTNPVHSSLGFSTTCTECHTTAPGWKPAKFAQHDALFPISSGNHSGNDCSECHTNPNDYKVFSCIICHTNQNELANTHNEVADYVYTNAKCYECHPRGRAGK